MGIDTKGILVGRFSPDEITDILIENGYQNISVRSNPKKEYEINGEPFWYTSSFLIFDEKTGDNRTRMMHVFQSDANRDYRNFTDLNDITTISLGWSGESEEIISSIVKKTGGWYVRADCFEEFVFFENRD
jgi:hypothetical protein